MIVVAPGSRFKSCAHCLTMRTKNYLISASQESSRGWFESDEAFQARVEASRAEWEAKNKKATKKKPAGAGGSGKSALPATTKWVTPGARTGGAWSKPAAKKKAPSAGGVFAAMMMDDSDSD